MMFTPPPPKREVCALLLHKVGGDADASKNALADVQRQWPTDPLPTTSKDSVHFELPPQGRDCPLHPSALSTPLAVAINACAVSRTRITTPLSYNSMTPLPK
jgi:hypothetical protein